MPFLDNHASVPSRPRPVLLHDVVQVPSVVPGKPPRRPCFFVAFPAGPTSVHVGRAPPTPQSAACPCPSVHPRCGRRPALGAPRFAATPPRRVRYPREVMILLVSLDVVHVPQVLACLKKPGMGASKLLAVRVLTCRTWCSRRCSRWRSLAQRCPRLSAAEDLAFSSDQALRQILLDALVQVLHGILSASTWYLNTRLVLEQVVIVPQDGVRKNPLGL